MEEENTNVSLDELFINEGFSIRTYHICKYNELLCLQKILSYYEKNRDFIKLRNCGIKSNSELVLLCNKFIKAKNKKYIIENKKKYANILDDLLVHQVWFLNYCINIEIDKLDNRYSQILRDYLNTVKNEKYYKNLVFINPNFNYEKITHFKEISTDVIERFLINIQKLVENVSKIKNKVDLQKKVLNDLLEERFNEYDKIYNLIDNVCNFKDGIPLFKTIIILIDNNYIYNEKEKEVFYYVMNIETTQKNLNKEKLSAKLNISRERVRQISEKIINSLDCKFSFITNLPKNYINLHGINTDSNLIIIKDDFINDISKEESVSLNNLFICKVYAILLAKEYDYFGQQLNIKERSNYSLFNWKLSYFVSIKLTNIFDFESLVNDVNLRISSKIVEEYKFHFQTYLLTFKKQDCFIHIDEISQIAEQILYNEFEIIIDSDDSINFPKNSMKTITDHIYDTLNKAKKPLTVYEIFDILNQQYPGISKSAEALRGSCQRDTRLIYFGRSSTYGLKTWEEKLENIKGGTMHDISEEFLLKFDEPKHIDEIAEYVRYYRNNVTSKNLLYNLKSAEHRRFIFFKNSFIGLVTKSYNTALFPSIPKYYSKKKSWDENYQLLELFTSKNEHLPFSSGNEEEIRLYRFFNIQVRKFSELSDSKKKLIENLMFKYNYQKSTRHNSMKWKKSYNELISFLHENRRMPSSRISNEQKLYGFFYRQRKLYKEEKLTKEYLSRFLEVTEIIKNIAR